MAKQTVVISDADFMENVTEARENGFEFCCSDCGVGIYDDSDEHDNYCPRNPRLEENLETLAKWSAERALSLDGPR